MAAPLNQSGRSVEEVIADLESKRDGDVRWADGRAFGMVYDGGPGVHEVAERAARLYLHENALNTKAFLQLSFFLGTGKVFNYFGRAYLHPPNLKSHPQIFFLNISY